VEDLDRPVGRSIRCVACGAWLDHLRTRYLCNQPATDAPSFRNPAPPGSISPLGKCDRPAVSDR
jgi:hypothetical protein